MVFIVNKSHGKTMKRGACWFRTPLCLACWFLNTCRYILMPCMQITVCEKDNGNHMISMEYWLYALILPDTYFISGINSVVDVSNVADGPWKLFGILIPPLLSQRAIHCFWRWMCKNIQNKFPKQFPDPWTPTVHISHTTWFSDLTFW